MAPATDAEHELIVEEEVTILNRELSIKTGVVIRVVDAMQHRVDEWLVVGGEGQGHYSILRPSIEASIILQR